MTAPTDRRRGAAPGTTHRRRNDRPRDAAEAPLGGGDCHSPADSPRCGCGSERGAIRSILFKVGEGLSGKTTSIGDVVGSLEGVSFSAVLLLLAIVIVSPLSGIPVLPSICGIAIALMSAQMIVQRRHIWLPNWVMKRHVPTARVRRSLALMERPAKVLDRVTRRRLEFVLTPPLSVLPKLICMACGLAMPILELVPFTSSILGVVVSILALAMIAGDGLLMLMGTSIVVALIGAALTVAGQWV